MGMPITVEVTREEGAPSALELVFAHFTAVDARFSTYKTESEVSQLNRGELTRAECSEELRDVLRACDDAQEMTNGYFNVETPQGTVDPSGYVKGWAIQKAAALLEAHGYHDYMIDAGGDIASSGVNARGESWNVGIRNPFNREEIVKVVVPHGKGVATSGTAVRGAHIYNPHDPSSALKEVVSITVIAPDILTADIYATAAFAMGTEGISFLERTREIEAYAIDAHGIATMTSGFPAYTTP